MTKKQLGIFVGLWLIVLAISAYHPKDFATWVLEVFPVIIAIPLLFYTRTSFPLSRAIYFWIFMHGLLLMTGGHYTYAEVPIGYWVKDALDLSRNNFDRLGHLMQGFVPALLFRELLIRQLKLKGAWLFLITVAFCMSFSVLYEFIEWAAAIIMGQGADAFLGTQGDQWDTQWDMFLATVGSILAQLIYRPMTGKDNKSR